jgi:hypothetical protein
MRIRTAVVAFFLCVSLPTNTMAYAVLAHEAIIDSAWDTSLRPLLLKRFPAATPEQLKEAHGYAYGGAIIQDMGYYPHGSFFFSDLAHYVRSGDFVLALLRDSKDLNGYALRWERWPITRRTMTVIRWEQIGQFLFCTPN